MFNIIDFGGYIDLLRTKSLLAWQLLDIIKISEREGIMLNENEAVHRMKLNTLQIKKNYRCFEETALF